MKKNIKNEKEKNKSAEKKDRYNEKQIIKGFLNSDKGITFLVDQVKEMRDRKSLSKNRKEDKSISEAVDNVLDFYLSWVHSCPARKAIKAGKYEFMLEIEKACDSEMKDVFSFILN